MVVCRWHNQQMCGRYEGNYVNGGFDQGAAEARQAFPMVASLPTKGRACKMQWIERVGHKGEERDGRQASTARQAKGQVVDKAHKTEEGGERRERGESGNGRGHVPAAQAYTRRRTMWRWRGGGERRHREDRACCQEGRTARVREGGYRKGKPFSYPTERQ